MTNSQIIITCVAAFCLVVICALFTVMIIRYKRATSEAITKGADDPALVAKALRRSKKQRIFIRILSGLWKGVVALVLLAAICFMAASIYTRVSGNRFAFGDQAYLVISSDSMSSKNPNNTYLSDEELQSQYDLDNQFPAYDTIGIQQYDSAADVKLYDVVAYESTSGQTVVHRIVDTVEEDGQVVGYITRGDTNNIDDTGVFYTSYLTYDDIIGYFDGKVIPVLGYPVVFLQSPAGIMTLVALAYCFITYDVVASRLDKSRKARTSFVLSALHITPEQLRDGSYNDLESVVIDGREYSFTGGQLTPREEA